ncbi:dihydrofolate reductase family protein [Labedaea rhizosphaerae]|uniref:Dihydrofolate reductase n=1 Tax=Labedaea rhizosphaerae TaxID=598644 RepID=A0A4V6PVV0_LABRH|nr:dihydrofolate reductase family protein [Labedaea rhizosphaerae]TDQ00221.1 dihydrofolate reductase [Labedaea rhizosphaerae]
MGKIVAFENVSLDGTTQDATGEEGFCSTDWRDTLAPADREAWSKLILEDALGARALLMGRRSYEFFATRYPSRTSPLADAMNSMPKYVVSSTLEDPGWANSTVLRGDPMTEVTKLKEAVDGEIRVYASAHLLHTLLDHDLVDELRLAVFPLLMGGGARFFDQQSNPKPLHPKQLRLVESRTVGDALLHLTYRPAPR